MSQTVNIIYIVISILSIFLYVMSVQFKSKKNILITQIGASLCYLTVYVIKGAWSGVAVEILEELKDVVFIRIEKHGKKIPMFVLVLFLFLLIVVSVIFYDGPFSLLPLVINILLFISTYFKDPKAIRYVMLLAGIMWGIYNAYLGAYIILIGNVLEVGSAVISIVRFKDDKKKKKITKRKTHKKTKKR